MSEPFFFFNNTHPQTVLYIDPKTFSFIYVLLSRLRCAGPIAVGSNRPLSHTVGLIQHVHSAAEAAAGMELSHTVQSHHEVILPAFKTVIYSP